MNAYGLTDEQERQLHEIAYQINCSQGRYIVDAIDVMRFVASPDPELLAQFSIGRPLGSPPRRRKRKRHHRHRT